MHRRLVARFPDIAVRSATPRTSPPYVSTPADVAVAGPAILAAIAEDIAAHGRPDACIIGCFGEPGLAAVRHSWDFPIVGMAEASIVSAMQMGGRHIAIVTAGRHWPRMLRDLLRAYGLERLCAGIVEVYGEPLTFAGDPARAVVSVQSAIDDAMRRFDPDCIVVGGASLVGLSGRLTAPVRIFDCLDAAATQALALAAYGRTSEWRRSH